MNKIAQNNVNLKLSDLELDLDSDYEDIEMEYNNDQPDLLIPIPKLER